MDRIVMLIQELISKEQLKENCLEYVDSKCAQIICAKRIQSNEMNLFIDATVKA